MYVRGADFDLQVQEMRDHVHVATDAWYVISTLTIICG
jgi:hypothetical protein